MTAIAAAENRRTGPERALPFIAALTVYAVLVAAGAKLLNDPDTYWHIAAGEWIVANGFPRTDPFSFTFAGEPWIAKEWLSQLLYYGAWRVAGWTGVVVLAAGALALAFGLFAHALARTLTMTAVVVALALAFLLVAPHAVARPHALALPLMVAWIAGIVAAADREKGPSLWLLPVMVAWANIHGGFTFGIMLAGAAGLDAVLSARSERRFATALVWGRFGLLALVAGCITPYGWESILVTFRIVGLGPALSIIHEWQPADFSSFGGLEFVLLAGAGLALLRGISLPPVRIVVLLGLVHMALSATRNAELLGLVAPLFVAAPLARQVPWLAADDDGPAKRMLPLAGGTLVAAALATVLAGSWIVYRPAATVTPAVAVEAIREAGAERVMNAYDFGGYLVAAGVPTFIDGRAELYGGPFVARQIAAQTLADLDGFMAALDDYEIDATLMPPAMPATALLDRLPGWRRLHADAIAVVHVRTDAD